MRAPNSNLTPLQELEVYTRQNRPVTYADKLVYDRMVRLLLNWLDDHKIKELKVFLAQEGKRSTVPSLTFWKRHWKWWRSRLNLNCSSLPMLLGFPLKD